MWKRAPASPAAIHRTARALALLAAGVATLLALGGCITVAGTGHGTGHSVTGSPADSGSTSDSDARTAGGLARPFLPLPSVSPAPVPDAYDAAQDAQATLAAALAAARSDGRPVLLDFGSAWCEDCVALSRLVDSPGIRLILARNYHLVTVDVGHYDRNVQFAARYVRLAQSGIPALALLAPDGSLRHASDDGRFAQARSLGADQFANILVDWLYPPYGAAG